MARYGKVNHRENNLFNKISNSRINNRNKKIDSNILLNGSNEDKNNLLDDKYPSEIGTEILRAISDVFDISKAEWKDNSIIIEHINNIQMIQIANAIRDNKLDKNIKKFSNIKNSISNMFDIRIILK